MIAFDRRPGPRVIPLEGDNGPAFQGGTAVPPSAGYAWESHPAAMLLVLIFALVLAWKVVR